MTELLKRNREAIRFGDLQNGTYFYLNPDSELVFMKIKAIEVRFNFMIDLYPYHDVCRKYNAVCVIGPIFEDDIWIHAGDVATFDDETIVYPVDVKLYTTFRRATDESK